MAFKYSEICQFNSHLVFCFPKLVTDMNRVQAVLIHKASKNCKLFKAAKIDQQTIESETLLFE